MSVRSTHFFPILFLLITGMPAYGAGLDDADERLFKVQQAIAEKGNSRAQYYLGEMHEQGLGTRQDIDEAFKWYAKAAEQGDPLAKRKLDRREEIIAETRKEREAEKPMPAEAVVVPEKPDHAPKTPGHPKPAVAETKNDTKNEAKKEPKTETKAVARADQAELEQEKIKAAEREKRRAMVRAMILEYIRNPVGDPFE